MTVEDFAAELSQHLAKAGYTVRRQFSKISQSCYLLLGWQRKGVCLGRVRVSDHPPGKRTAPCLCHFYPECTQISVADAACAVLIRLRPEAND